MAVTGKASLSFYVVALLAHGATTATSLTVQQHTYHDTDYNASFASAHTQASQTTYSSWDADIANKVLGDASLDYHEAYYYDVMTALLHGGSPTINFLSTPITLQYCSASWVGSGNYPFVGKAESQQDGPSELGVGQVTDICTHPSGDNSVVMVTKFNVPVAGSYTIDYIGAKRVGCTIFSNVDYFVYDTDGSLISSVLAVDNADGWKMDSGSYSLGLRNPGDSFYFAISNGGNGYGCDSAQIRFRIVRGGAGGATAGAGGATAVGDPHLQNIHGERFDLMKEGKHVLISIPRGKSAEQTFLRVQADARRLGGQCADMYFQELNVTGSWAEANQAGGYHYSVSQSEGKTPEWVTFGKVDLKVVHGRTNSGLRYLNVYVKHLGRAGFAVGGLLGEDDHADVIVPPAECGKRMALLEFAQGDRIF